MTIASTSIIFKKKTKKTRININEIDSNRIFSFNKATYGVQGSHKYYIGYLGGEDWFYTIAHYN